VHEITERWGSRKLRSTPGSKGLTKRELLGKLGRCPRGALRYRPERFRAIFKGWWAIDSAPGIRAVISKWAPRR
jgi:hypothetical protein